MKILRRLKVEAISLDEFQEIYKNHDKEITDIITKYYSPIFKKMKTSLVNGKSSYITLAYNIACTVNRLTYPSTASFNLELSKDITAILYIGRGGDAGFKFGFPHSIMQVDEIKSMVKYLSSLSSISEKDFSDAFEKSKKDLQKSFEKWEKE